MISNGQTGYLIIEGIHNGEAGIQDARGRLRIGFQPNRRLRSPLAAKLAMLDGKAYAVDSIARSALVNGWYVAELSPTTIGTGEE